MTEWQTYEMKFECKKCKTEYKSMVDYQLTGGAAAADIDKNKMNDYMLWKIKTDKTKCVKCKGRKFRCV